MLGLKGEKNHGKWLTLKDLKFHSSWSWLMPVIEKVEKLDAKLDVNDLLEALQNLEDELFPLSST